MVIDGKHGRSIVLDLFFEPGTVPKPVVVFAHGFKGYKDWGCWNLVAEAFARKGFAFCKFNFSYNGGTVEDPIDFPDLEAFGQNNYRIELEDLGSVIEFIHSANSYSDQMNADDVNLIGHSRGGGICVLGAANYGIKKLVTWAAVSDFEARIPVDQLEEWKEKGVLYAYNGRTRQNMPMYYQFYETLIRHKEELHIERAARKLNIPALIVHGDQDEAVSVQNANDLHGWIAGSRRAIIPGAGHTFGSKQPWMGDTFPDDLKQVVDFTVGFLYE